jgi:hypothetical protein
VLVEEMPDGFRGMPHDACFVWDKVLARNWGVQDGLVGRLHTPHMPTHHKLQKA